MVISDDTTTQLNTDLDEDRMQILNGTDRLKYFADASDLMQPKSSKKSRLISYISKLLK